MEQLVARWAHNPEVACSSHAPATTPKGTNYRLMKNMTNIVEQEQEETLETGRAVM